MKQVTQLILSDLYRYGGNANASTLIRHLLLNPGFRYSFWLRLCHTSFAPLRLLAIGVHRHMSNRYAIQIPRRTRIGHGLYIGHHTSIVVNETAVIGNNCNLGPFTCIGSNKGQAATIGDNVYIGPGVCIVEDVSIGCDATIGAGSVVVKPVPAGATVAGNPARVVSHKDPGRFVCHRWKPVAPVPATEPRSPSAPSLAPFHRGKLRRTIASAATMLFGIESAEQRVAEQGVAKQSVAKPTAATTATDQEHNDAPQF